MDPSTLTCANGTPWLDHMQPPIGSGKGCQACDDDTERACLRFDVAVFWGQYDAQGYTPAERRLQQRKAASESRSHR